MWVKGASGFVLIKDKGVLIKVKTSQEGLALGLGVEGFVIEMK